MTAKRLLASINCLLVISKSPSALTFWALHPSKVSVASFKAASAA